MQTQKTNSPKTLGTLDAWRNAINCIIENEPVMQTLFCFAVGSYLKNRLAPNAHNLVVNLSGKSSTGKTTSLECLMSIESRPIVKDYRIGSSTALMLLASESDGGFLCASGIERFINSLPELSDDRVLHDLLTRHRQEISNEGQRSTIQLTAFIESGMSIFGSSIERYSIEFEKPIAKANIRLGNARDVINENYGHAYAAIQQASAANHELESLYHHFLKLHASFQCENSTGRAENCGLAFAAIPVLEDIGLTIDFNAVSNLLMRKAIASNNDAERPFDMTDEQVKLDEQIKSVEDAPEAFGF